MDSTNQNLGQYGQIQTPNNINPYQNMKAMEAINVSRPHIRKFMREFNDKTKRPFNKIWFERSDEDLIEGMKRIILSCERNKYFILKVLGFDVITDYEEINKILYNYYNQKSKKNKKVDNEYEYINLKDSDVMLMRVRYYIKLNIPKNKIKLNENGEPEEPTEGEIETYIILPRYVNKYYFRIYGNYYSPIFQIVDGSTYNNTTSNSSNRKLQITLKTNFMPITVYKETYKIVDAPSNTSKKCALFASYIFAKKIDAMKYILGRYGLYGAEEFLELQGIYVQDAKIGHIMDPSKFYNFYDPSLKILVSVFKILFNNDYVTQSFVYTLLKNSGNLNTFEEIFDPRYWVRNLGSNFKSGTSKRKTPSPQAQETFKDTTLEKGIPVLESFEAILDLGTKELLKLPEEDKADSYRIIRWMMREFNVLRGKNNIDISTKHPRMADEYLPAIYAIKISKGLYRITDSVKNITFKQVVSAINIQPNYILKNISSACLVNYVDLVNDNDAELALSYTYKGLSGIGHRGTTNSFTAPSSSRVPKICRSVHPSHLGRVDLDSSSASDPGLSGIICPMAELHDGSFEEYQESDTWRDNYKETINELHRMYNMHQVAELSQKVGLTYDYVKDQLVKEIIESYQAQAFAFSPIEISVTSEDDEQQELSDSEFDDEEDEENGED